MHFISPNRAGQKKMGHPMHNDFEDRTMNTIVLRIAIACAALLMLATNSRAETFELITAAEATSEAQAIAAAPPETRTRGVPVVKPGQPAIRIVSPAAPGTAVAAPVRIELAFKPAPGARIVPSSFRVLYGLLKIDLTDRLKKHATVSETGVIVDQAQVPAGQHRLLLQVADDQGNTAEQELRIRVGAAS